LSAVSDVALNEYLFLFLYNYKSDCVNMAVNRWYAFYVPWSSSFGYEEIQYQFRSLLYCLI